MLLDVKGSCGLTGKAAEELLDSANMTCNKNTIPFDEEKPFVASGLRLGTPALTTRGFREPEMRRTGELIVKVLRAPADEAVKSEVVASIAEMTRAMPLYKELRDWLKPVAE
jgi:glycine hydroxymethyltransferase